jgi:hypothetical protein
MFFYKDFEKSKQNGRNYSRKRSEQSEQILEQHTEQVPQVWISCPGAAQALHVLV